MYYVLVFQVLRHMPLFLLLMPFCMLLQNSSYSRLRDINTHIPQTDYFPQWTKVLRYLHHSDTRKQLSCLVTNSHVYYLAGVMGVMEINSLTTVLQRKAMETLNAVGGNLPFRCHIFLRSLGHLLKEMQKGISLLLALQWYLGTVWCSILCLLRIQ